MSLIEKKVFGLILAVCLFLYTAHYLVVGNMVWGDGRYYYSYTRSWVIDQDIDFSNESQTQPFFFNSIVTPAGKLLNKYSIGTPILWLPWFVMAHLISLGLSMVSSIPADGYHHLYRIFVGLGSVFYGWLGIFLAYKTAKKITNKSSALLATVIIFLTTNLIFYTGIDPVNSHPSNIFISSWLVYLLVNNSTKLNFKKFFSLGCLVGLIALIRPQDAIFILPLLLLTFKENLKSFIASLVGFGVVFSLQLLTWLIMIGSITNPYGLLGEGFNWFNPQIIKVWFSSNNGLFYYSPTLIISIWGWLKNIKLNKWYGYGLGLFLIQSYIVGSWHGWWGGASYGARMFLSLTVFFVIGLAGWLKEYKIKTKYVVGVTTILLILNILQITKLLLSN